MTALQGQRSVIENCNACLANSAFTLAAEFFQQFDLNLLNLEEPIVLPPQQVIDLLVQVPNLELGFEIDLVIIFRRDMRESS